VIRYYKTTGIFDGSAAAVDGEARATLTVPGIGRLCSVVVSQVAGSLQGFSASLHSLKEAYPTNWPEPADPVVVQATNPTLYAVAAPVVAANTVQVASWFDSSGQPYMNIDTTVRGARIDKLYLRIVANSPGVGKQFDVMLGIEDYD